MLLAELPNQLGTVLRSRELAPLPVSSRESRPAVRPKNRAIGGQEWTDQSCNVAYLLKTWKQMAAPGGSDGTAAVDVECQGALMPPLAPSLPPPLPLMSGAGRRSTPSDAFRFVPTWRVHAPSPRVTPVGAGRFTPRRSRQVVCEPLPQLSGSSPNPKPNPAGRKAWGEAGVSEATGCGGARRREAASGQSSPPRLPPAAAESPPPALAGRSGLWWISFVRDRAASPDAVHHSEGGEGGGEGVGAEVGGGGDIGPDSCRGRAGQGGGSASGSDDTGRGHRRRPAASKHIPPQLRNGSIVEGSYRFLRDDAVAAAQAQHALRNASSPLSLQSSVQEDPEGDVSAPNAGGGAEYRWGAGQGDPIREETRHLEMLSAIF